jgi:hypothetical protein
MYDNGANNGAWLHFIDWKFLRGIKPEVFTLLRSGSFRFAQTRKYSLCIDTLRFFLTVNSAGDRKRPIQKEGGLYEREKN